MSKEREQLIRYLENGAIDREQGATAFHLGGLYPQADAWYKFLDRVLLGIGALCVSLALIFFIAFNWQAIGEYAKFALVQTILVATIAGYLLIKPPLVQRGLLTLASITTGVLLALYGQTYQTGADPWQLFLTWALLISPWVLVANFSPLWLLFIGLINLALVLWSGTQASGIFWFGNDEQSLLWAIFTLNLVGLVLWEIVVGPAASMGQRIVAQALAVASGAAITVMAAWAIFDPSSSLKSTLLVWPLWGAGVFFIYRHQRPDLFMLAGLCLAGLVLATCLFIKILPNNADVGGYLLLSVVVLGLGSAATAWLRRVHRLWTQDG